MEFYDMNTLVLDCCTRDEIICDESDDCEDIYDSCFDCDCDYTD